MAIITADTDIYATMFNPYLDWEYKQYIDTYSYKVFIRTKVFICTKVC